MTKAVFQTRHGASTTIGGGRITWAGWPLRPRAEIPGSIVAQRQAIVNSRSVYGLLWAVNSR